MISKTKKNTNCLILFDKKCYCPLRSPSWEVKNIILKEPFVLNLRPSNEVLGQYSESEHTFNIMAASVLSNFHVLKVA